jgi:hypothetical protein
MIRERNQIADSIVKGLAGCQQGNDERDSLAGGGDDKK